MLAPWLDGREALTILRTRGLDNPAIATQMANGYQISVSRSGAWQPVVACPSAQHMTGISCEPTFLYWRECAVILSCLPEHERNAAVNVISSMSDPLQRSEWLAAAIWLWRDERAKKMLEDNDIVSFDDNVRRHASRCLRMRAWRCNSEWIHDDAQLTAADLADQYIQRAVAFRLCDEGRLPRWAEDALRQLPSNRRDATIAAILDAMTGQSVSLTIQAPMARSLRSLGWNGEHGMVAEAALFDGDRGPSLEGTCLLLRVFPLRRWSELPGGTRGEALALLRRTMVNDDLRTLQSALSIEERKGRHQPTRANDDRQSRVPLRSCPQDATARNRSAGRS